MDIIWVRLIILKFVYYTTWCDRWCGGSEFVCWCGTCSLGDDVDSLHVKRMTCSGFHSVQFIGQLGKIVVILNEGPREVTEGGGVVNGSLIKFFCKNRPIFQVQIPKAKSCKNVMNTPTKSVEMILSKVRTQRKKNGINWTTR
jgi:hypothetical protein